ncbi:MAG: hypothetical protein JWP89_3524 [Schlesneria sp.]|nr:hypothetical protein [Schlesneria sp.]
MHRSQPARSLSNRLVLRSSIIAGFPFGLARSCVGCVMRVHASGTHPPRHARTAGHFCSYHSRSESESRFAIWPMSFVGHVSVVRRGCVSCVMQIFTCNDELVRRLVSSQTPVPPGCVMQTCVARHPFGASTRRKSRQVNALKVRTLYLCSIRVSSVAKLFSAGSVGCVIQLFAERATTSSYGESRSCREFRRSRVRSGPGRRCLRSCPRSCCSHSSLR